MVEVEKEVVFEVAALECLFSFFCALGAAKEVEVTEIEVEVEVEVEE